MTLKEQNEITASGFTLRKEIQQCPCVEARAIIGFLL